MAEECPRRPIGAGLLRYVAAGCWAVGCQGNGRACRGGRAGRAAAELAGWGGAARLDPYPLVRVGLGAGQAGEGGGRARAGCSCEETCGRRRRRPGCDNPSGGGSAPLYAGWAMRVVREAGRRGREGGREAAWQRPWWRGPGAG